MKSILSLFIILISATTFSQEYLPLLSEGKRWSTVDEYYHLVLGGANRSFHYYLEGDTAINDTGYYRIHKIDDYQSTDELVGYVREDTSQKVYFRNTSEEECLIYDFSVEVNDTIDFYYSGVPNTPIQAIVEGFGVFEATTPNRKTIILKGVEIPAYSEIWIEGIGSERGLLESGFTFSMLVGAQFNLLCYQESDSVLYLNPRFSGCSWPLDVGTNLKMVRDNGVSVYPNPIVNSSTFKVENWSEPCQIEFYNTVGQLVLRKHLSGTNSFQIEITDFESGIIFYKVESKNQILKGTFQILK